MSGKSSKQLCPALYINDSICLQLQGWWLITTLLLLRVVLTSRESATKEVKLFHQLLQFTFLVQIINQYLVFLFLLFLFQIEAKHFWVVFKMTLIA